MANFNNGTTNILREDGTLEMFGSVGGGSATRRFNTYAAAKKAFDDGDLEVGTEVYIVNDERVSGNGTANIYSEEETIVGSFLGKPLYRKYIVLQEGNLVKNTNYGYGIANIDRIINIKYWYNRNDDSTIIHGGYDCGSDYVHMIPAKAGIWYAGAPTSYRLYKLCAILEYTKTTD